MKNITFVLILLSACTVSKSTNTINPFRGDVAGCGNFIVYKLSEDGNQFISVALHAASIELGASQTFSIGRSEAVEIKWKKFEGDVGATLCNDVVGQRPRRIYDFTATSGTLNVQIDEVELVKVKAGDPYNVNLLLKNVVFDSLVVDYLEIKDAKVGWIPG